MVHLDATLAVLQRRRLKPGAEAKASRRSSRRAKFKAFYHETSPQPPPKFSTAHCSPGRRVLLVAGTQRPRKPALSFSELSPQGLRRFNVRVSRFPASSASPASAPPCGDLFIVAMPRGPLRRFNVRPASFPGDPYVCALRRFKVDVKIFPKLPELKPLRSFHFAVDAFPVKEEKEDVVNSVEEEEEVAGGSLEEEVAGLEEGLDVQEEEENLTEEKPTAGTRQGCFLQTEEVMEALEEAKVAKLQRFRVHPGSFPFQETLQRFHVDRACFPLLPPLPQPTAFTIDPAAFPYSTTPKLRRFGLPPDQFPSRSISDLRRFCVHPDAFPLREWESIKGLQTRWKKVREAPSRSAGVVDFGSRVTVHMKGWSTKKDVPFWDTHGPGESAYTFNAGVGKIVKGLDAAIIGMKVGELRHVNVASVEGYGQRGFPQWGIKPNQDLHFEVELIGIG